MSKNHTNNNGKKSYIFTKETFGMTLLLFSAIVFIMLCSGSAVFADIGKAICTFMYGTFGFGSYLIIALTAYLGEFLVFGKNIKLSLRKILTISLTVFSFFLLFHAVTTRAYSMDGYGKYIADCYLNAQNGFTGYTFGGVISAIFVYPLAKAGGFVTAYVLFSILVLAFGYLTVSAFLRVSGRITQSNDAVVEDVPREFSYETVKEVQQPVRNTTEPAEEHKDENDKFSQKNLGRKILFGKGEFSAESYRRNMIFNGDSYFNHPVTSEADYLSSFSSKPKKAQTYTERYQDEVYNQQPSMPSSYVYGDKPVENLNAYDDNPYYSDSVPDTDYAQPEIRESNLPSAKDLRDGNSEPYNPYSLEDRSFVPPEDRKFEEPGSENSYNARERGIVGFTDSTPVENESGNYDVAAKREESEKDDIYNFLNTDVKRVELERADKSAGRRVERGAGRNMEKNERSNSGLFDALDTDDGSDAENDIFSDGRTEPVSEPVRPAPVVRREQSKSAEPVAPVEEKKDEEKPKHVWKKYVRPPLDLLDDYPENANVNTSEIEDNKQIIVETLAKFKIASNVANVTIGPSITRYDVIIEDKTNIKRSLGYRDAIAMELRKDNVNAYLNYSKGALSIEVPNNKRAVVGLKTMLANQKFFNCKPSSLTFALGKSVDGEVVCPDITKMPHLLVAGTTGSGKSICLSALLVSLLYKYGPEELRLILVDPKQVEFISYDKLPHLMINEIIYECDKAIKALNWAIKEMEHRYSLFKDMTEAGIATKNLDEYNAHLKEGEERLPKIVIILDEFGDLMLQAKKDIESRIIKLVQKARACGIHLILATQRPSVDCITGLIKSNLPTRIGFKVNSFDDARTIFDIGGAEKLLGKGDAYFRSAENPDLARIQCCFVDTPEVQRVTDFVKEHNETYFDQGVSDFINTVEQEEKPASIMGDEEESNETKIDDTFIRALKYCVTSNQASVSMLQRRFPVGYIKACKIIDWMENMNYVTPSEGSKPRKVLLSKEEFFNIYGDIDD